MENIDKIIRGLAKNNYWQCLYACAKETSIRLFKNNDSFTHLQVFFLNFLNFYHNIFIDIAMGDVNEVVLKDDIYEDAYVYYKNKKRGLKEEPKQVQDNKKQTKTSYWVFNKPKRN